MVKIYYINGNGVIKRRKNNISILKIDKTEKVEKIIPINNIDLINCIGAVSLSSGVISLISKRTICINFISKYGFLKGSFQSRKSNSNGTLLIKQCEHFIDKNKRLVLAKKFLYGGFQNMIRNLEYYNRRGYDFERELVFIKESAEKIKFENKINSLMAIEGNIRNEYYKIFNKILPEEFKFFTRTKNPPKDKINCLISFGNCLLYSILIKQIYKTPLDQSVSYLHEPIVNRFSLSLDISEVFKPLIVDRVILKIIRKDIIKNHHFNIKNDIVYLNENGRKVFIENFEDKINKTIKINNKKISYKNLLLMECYKLIKHFHGLKTYEPYVSGW
ncbi:MAG: type I-B CRISPR-associated endonuclease Cas1b [Candidatus Aenigmarchaeota archaeon]|nr:type I-B CRISPR-associated endonuclease Cas1b [Candidatus Aenigmarchaeota archaeon]